MKHWLILGLTTVLGVTVLFVIDGYYRAQIRQENSQHLTASLAAVKQHLEEEIDLRILVVEDLRAFIQASPTLPDQETFDRYAASVLVQAPEVRALQYADPDHIIRYIYPLAGNEAALGLDLMTRPAAPFVEKARRTRQTTINDPTVTVQGSLSIVVRSPIYDGDRYLGLAQGVFDIAPLLAIVSQELSPHLGILLQDANGNIFWQTERFSGQSRRVTVAVGDNRWALTLGWVSPESQPQPYVLGLIWGLGGALLISILFIINQTARQVTALATAVEENTAALAASEKRYRTLVETADDVILLTDLNGRPLFRNSAYYTSLGFKEAAAAELDDFSRVHPDDEPRLRQKMRALSGTLTTEYRIRHQDGHWVHRYAHFKLIRDEQGDPQSIMGIIRDITARKQAERAVRFQADLLAIVEQAVMATDLRGRITYWNRFAEQLYGWSAEEVIGRDVLDITPALITPAQASEIMAELREGKSWSGEFTVRRKDHTTFLAMVTNSPIYDDQGTLVGIVSISSDITKRKQAAEALREIAGNMAAAQRIAHFGSWEIGLTDDLAFIDPQLWSEECYRILGVEPGSIEITSEFFYRHVHPDDRQFAFQALQKIIREGAESAYEFRLIRPDGAIRYIRDRAKVILDEQTGRPIKVVGIVRDMTERKQAEKESRLKDELLQMTGEMAQVGGWEFDAQTQQETWTNEVARIYDLEPDQPTDVGLGLSFYPPGSREKIDQAIKEALELAKPYDLELEMVSAKGVHKWVRTMGLPVRENGQVIKVRGIFQDITARKQLEEERVNLEKQFYQAQKMEAVGQLTAGIAHDFNNLIMAINGNAELMQLQLRPEDPFYAKTDTILHAGSRAANLVRQLLIFSRKQILTPQIVALNTIITEMHQLLARIIGENIAIELNLAADLWAIKVDPAQIEQVIVNLVVNARDAMPEGGRLILETANVVLAETDPAGQMASRPGEYIRLSVSDTGVGMSREVQDHLFEPFFTTKAADKGTGLGLATVYGIVKQSNGTIWVDSAVGQGTSFKIYLPRTTEIGAPPSPAPHLEAVERGHETILVVEDDAAIRVLARDILKKQGYTVLEAGNSQQALQVAAHHAGPIHLLLTDIVMPGMSGQALSEELVQHYPQLKVVYMSGYSDAVISPHGMLKPGLVLLQKPFRFVELVRKIQDVLR